MKNKTTFQMLWAVFGLMLPFVCVSAEADDRLTTVPPERPRIIVTTDIGGSDFDDFQSMVHYLVYADRFDTEGLVSSPMGATGRKEFILQVLDTYEQDYPNLRTYSDRYPAPQALRSMTRQGTTAPAPLGGVGTATEGSDWIIRCAKRPDPRPLWILAWGGLEDVAQALHDDPSIEPRLRVYFIGGPNKKWSPRAYNYLALHHPTLWMIEDNSSYYGWFTGGNQTGDLGNAAFVTAHVRGQGAMGDFFSNGIKTESKVRSAIKMGDTPSVAYMLGRHPEDPTQESWGGQFVRAWDRPHKVFEHAPALSDQVETYAIVEMLYHLRARSAPGATAMLEVGKQDFPGYADAEGVWHFIYCPKEPGKWTYRVKSSDSQLDGQTGAFTSTLPEANQPVSEHYPHWWTDNPDPRLAEGIYQGAKTVSRWREEYLRDFAERMQRCKSPKPAPGPATKP